jgi:hypothetical protein
MDEVLAEQTQKLYDALYRIHYTEAKGTNSSNVAEAALSAFRIWIDGHGNYCRICGSRSGMLTVCPDCVAEARIALQEQPECLSCYNPVEHAGDRCEACQADLEAWHAGAGTKPTKMTADLCPVCQMTPGVCPACQRPTQHRGELCAFCSDDLEAFKQGR